MAVYDIDGNEIANSGGGTATDIVSVNDRPRTIEKLQQLNRPTRLTGGADATYGTDPLCLVQFSDIHGDGAALQRLADYVSEYGDYIDTVVHCGDMVQTISTDGITFWDNVTGAAHFLNCIGNHDSRTNSSWTGKTAASCYSTYFAPYISNWGVTIGTDVCYYYKDYSTEKVRLIVLDSMHQDATQLQWFTDTLASARTNSLHVIAVTHVYPYKKNVIPSNQPWDATKDWNKTDGKLDNSTAYPAVLADDYAAAVDTFQNAGGYFVCWLHGHLHRRLFRKLDSYPGQLAIGVTNGGDTYASNPSMQRTQDTKTEDCFNIVAVDTYSKILRGISVGANIDRWMIEWNEFCYDYNSGTVISAR